ncbi:hypothetical protein D3C86_1138580 [compost metagenome]
MIIPWSRCRPAFSRRRGLITRSSKFRRLMTPSCRRSRPPFRRWQCRSPTPPCARSCATRTSSTRHCRFRGMRDVSFRRTSAISAPSSGGRSCARTRIRSTACRACAKWLCRSWRCAGRVLCRITCQLRDSMPQPSPFSNMTPSLFRPTPMLCSWPRRTTSSRTGPSCNGSRNSTSRMRRRSRHCRQR